MPDKAANRFGLTAELGGLPSWNLRGARTFLQVHPANLPLIT